jgi:glycosyltransferase involved in cell wall biosynthesis
LQTDALRNLSSQARASCAVRIVFFANGIYGDHVAGGDIHLFEVAKGAAAAGYSLHFFGGKALEKRLASLKVPHAMTETNNRVLDKSCEQSLRGQVELLWDYCKRLCRSLARLKEVKPHDFVYAMADGWFDVVPTILSRAKRKMMILHMEAPSLWQILKRSRPDVDTLRLAALHYWASQQLALKLFRVCRRKHIFYVHPNMRPRLLNSGFKESEIRYISYGLDTEQADAVPEQPRIYDAVWIGRIHRQKGIADLLRTLAYLAKELPQFRAVIIGKSGEALAPEIEKLGLSKSIVFSGLVSEQEKFQLLKSSRVFLMPSRHEGSPRTVAEALLCRVPVVAYDVETYRPLFGNLVRYAPCFDLEQFKEEAKEQILKMRAGENYLEKMDLEKLRKENSWATVRQVFCQALAMLK